jgi:hypothetical protein
VIAYLLAGFLILLGVFMLSFLPKATAFHAELQRAGKLTADEARQKRKSILAGGVCAISLGVVMLLLVILKS